MKKAAAFVLTLCMILALFAGCGQASQTIDTPGPATGTPAADASAFEPTPEPKPAPPAAAPAEADALARGFLDGLEDCPYVAPEENLIGFHITKIEKDGGDYIVYWGSTNDTITGNSGNIAYAFSLIKFFDPEDYTNTYQGFTMDGSSMQVDFKEGEFISYDHVRVTFDTPSDVVYLYFAGAADGPEELYTVPLFYTLILDDNPRVFEDTPRAAGSLFD